MAKKDRGDSRPPCPRCGQQYSPGIQRFCARCGLPLAVAPIAPPPAPHRPPVRPPPLIRENSGGVVVAPPPAPPAPAPQRRVGRGRRWRTIIVLAAFIAIMYYYRSRPVPVPATPRPQLLPSRGLLPSSASPTKAIRLMQSHHFIGARGQPLWDWTVWVDGSEKELAKILTVTYHLHESFNPREVVVSTSANRFAMTQRGWGTFTLRATVTYRTGTSTELELPLKFSDPTK